MLDVFSINYLACLSFLSCNFLKCLLSLLFNLRLKQIDFFDILVVLESHQNLHVISLKSQALLVLLVGDIQLLVFLLLNLLLKPDIEGGGLHKRLSQISWQDDVHDVHLLNNHSVW